MLGKKNEKLKKLRKLKKLKIKVQKTISKKIIGIAFKRCRTSTLILIRLKKSSYRRPTKCSNKVASELTVNRSIQAHVHLVKNDTFTLMNVEKMHRFNYS